TGPAGHDGPVNHVVPVWDIVAAVAAANALMAAERHRRNGGEGQYVRLALSDVAFSTLGHLGYIGEVQINDEERPRLGNHVYGSFAHDFPTRDRRRVIVTAFTPRHWRALVEAAGTQNEIDALARAHGYDFTKEEDRFAAREHIVEIFSPWFAARTLAEVRAELDRAGACWGPYQTFSQAVREDARVSEDNPMFAEIDQPGIGRVLSAGVPADFGAWERTRAEPAPRFGQHTEQILADDLGLAAGEIAALFDAGIVAGAT
ncbi:MAG: CoA transferase, partial [Rhodospirillales bacterium]